MAERVTIRERSPDDDPAIEILYRDAFPDEDLLPVVRDLHREESGVVALVAIDGESLVGHVIFTTCRIAGRPEVVWLLAPLAVMPARHRQGIGTALVRAGLRQAERAGAAQVFVLGDPVYYGRFGFRAEDSVAPPYHLPEEWRGAWQSLSLSEDTQPPRGPLSVPEPWRRPELWMP